MVAAEGDVRLQHALHFASCEAARRIQRAYRRHRWFMQILRDVRESASASPPGCERPRHGAHDRVDPHPRQPLDALPRPRRGSESSLCRSLPKLTAQKPSAKPLKQPVAKPQLSVRRAGSARKIQVGGLFEVVPAQREAAWTSFRWRRRQELAQVLQGLMRRPDSFSWTIVVGHRGLAVELRV